MNSAMNDNATLAPNKPDRPKHYLRTIGGLLLAVYLPPVFAILIAIRWKDVPKWLRCASVILSFLLLPAILWEQLGKGTAHELFGPGAPAWAGYLTWSFFSACYMKHRGLRPSWLIKTGAAFIAFTLLFGTLMALTVYLRR